eukprot:COSAG06_NODE_915_length_11567_cov_9.166013_2_plen_235_part_00
MSQTYVATRSTVLLERCCRRCCCRRCRRRRCRRRRCCCCCCCVAEHATTYSRGPYDCVQHVHAVDAPVGTHLPSVIVYARPSHSKPKMGESRPITSPYLRSSSQLCTVRIHHTTQTSTTTLHAMLYVHTEHNTAHDHPLWQRPSVCPIYLSVYQSTDRPIDAHQSSASKRPVVGLVACEATGVQRCKAAVGCVSPCPPCESDDTSHHITYRHISSSRVLCVPSLSWHNETAMHK